MAYKLLNNFALRRKSDQICFEFEQDFLNFGND